VPKVAAALGLASLAGGGAAGGSILDHPPLHRGGHALHRENASRPFFVYLAHTMPHRLEAKRARDYFFDSQWARIDFAGRD